MAHSLRTCFFFRLITCKGNEDIFLMINYFTLFFCRLAAFGWFLSTLFFRDRDRVIRGVKLHKVFFFLALFLFAFFFLFWTNESMNDFVNCCSGIVHSGKFSVSITHKTQPITFNLKCVLWSVGDGRLEIRFSKNCCNCSSQERNRAQCWQYLKWKKANSVKVQIHLFFLYLFLYEVKWSHVVVCENFMLLTL